MKQKENREPLLSEDKVNMSTGASSAGSVKFTIPEASPTTKVDRYIPKRTDVALLEPLMNDSSVNNSELNLNDTLVMNQQKHRELIAGSAALPYSK